jgi:hypothetical protein
MKIESKMIGHISYTTHHVLRTEYKIKDKFNIDGGLTFYSETCTQKIDDFEFGDSETIFYFNVKDKYTFKTIEEILKSKGIDYETIQQ